MYASLTVTTPPTGTLVSSQTCRQHLKLDQVDDETLVATYLGMATEIVQNYLNKSLLTQSLSFTLGSTSHIYNGVNNFPILNGYSLTYGFRGLPSLKLPRGPVQSVESVTRGFWGYTDVTLVQGVDYDFDPTLGRVVMYNDYYNTALQDHITVNYTAGYGTVTDVPQQIIYGVLLTLGGIYFNRGDADRTIVSPAAYSLLDSYIERQFGNFHN